MDSQVLPFCPADRPQILQIPQPQIDQGKNHQQVKRNESYELMNDPTLDKKVKINEAAGANQPEKERKKSSSRIRQEGKQPDREQRQEKKKPRRKH